MQVDSSSSSSSSSSQTSTGTLAIVRGHTKDVGDHAWFAGQYYNRADPSDHG